MTRARATLSDFLAILGRYRKTIWLGQSVDTSVIHTTYPEYDGLPILTSVGCVMRRPAANGAKFDKRLRARVGAAKKLMVDSGGFVLMARHDLHWSVANVAELYRKIDADYLVSLDVPPNGHDRKPDRRRKYERTIENLEVLLPEFGDRLVPVVHGRGHDELEQNCQRIHALAPSPKLIGIGGLVPLLQRCGNVRSPGADTPQANVADAIHCVRRYFPQAKIHLFGVGSLHTVLGVIAAGADSVDSIGWRQAAGFGSVYIPGRHRRLLTHRERETPCRPFADRRELEILRSCPCPACRSAPRSNIAALTDHFKPRAAHNIWVLYSEIAAYLEARGSRRASAYLATRLSDAWLGALQ